MATDRKRIRNSARLRRRAARSMVRYGNLNEIFNSYRDRPYDVHLARLSVLYEDLRIEIQGMIARSIVKLDVLDPQSDHQDNPTLAGRYRRYYFLRRSVATLREFAECFDELRECPEFKKASEDDVEVAKTLQDAIHFFSANIRQLRKVRNDIGGHFGKEAAQHAVENLDPKGSSKIEFILDKVGQPKDPRLHYAGDIAAAALSRSLPGKDLAAEVEHFIQTVLVSAYTHATQVVQVFIAIDLAHRFGK
jgi:hypothetical protein